MLKSSMPKFFAFIFLVNLSPIFQDVMAKSCDYTRHSTSIWNLRYTRKLANDCKSRTCRSGRRRFGPYNCLKTSDRRSEKTSCCQTMRKALPSNRGKRGWYYFGG